VTASGRSPEPCRERRSLAGPRLRLAVLFSGGGRTLENLAGLCRAGSLPAEIVLAVSSHEEAGGIERARSHGIPVAVVDYRQAGGAFSDEVTRAVDGAAPDLVALGGFLRRWRLAPRYEGRVMNIHPALLPAFGGKGFYGNRVHRAVLAAGVKFSGCTVHYVTDEYDRGPIIIQRVVPVAPGDTVESLAARVFREECIAYPEAIRLHAAGRLEIAAGTVRMAGAGGLAAS
jgi:formyltetrahydrofolate-dependent phosphoribosylglycinamide formyltransferase